MTDDDFMAGIVAGSLEVRLARSAEDVDAVQALRYRVFYEEMAADPSGEMAARERDFDRFDTYCDHLMVIDHDRSAGNKVVGTYRLLRRSVADAHGGFYSSWEYDIDAIVDATRRDPGAWPLLRRSRLPQRHHPDPALAGQRGLRAALRGADHVRLRQLSGHRPSGARRAALLPLSLPPRAASAPPARQGRALRELGPDPQGGVGQARPRARPCRRLIKGYLEAQRLHRRRRGDRLAMGQCRCQHRGQDRPRDTSATGTSSHDRALRCCSASSAGPSAWFRFN